MENILSIKNDFIYLNSSLSEELFAKTKFSLMLNETGYIVSKSTDGTFSDFKPWKFTGTKTINVKGIYGNILSISVRFSDFADCSADCSDSADCSGCSGCSDSG